MRLFLLGFMGCGKSYSGQLLAELFEVPFIDLDNYIEKKMGQTIRNIFEKKGEAYFRKIEKECLYEIKKKERIVISVGGGTPCFFDNMEWMNKNGLTVYIETPVSILANRLAANMEHRPLLKDFTKKDLESFIEKKLEERNPYYHQAQILYEQKEEEQDVAGDLKKYFYNLV